MAHTIPASISFSASFACGSIGFPLSLSVALASFAGLVAHGNSTDKVPQVVLKAEKTHEVLKSQEPKP